MDGLLNAWGQIAWAQCWQVTLLIAGVWLVLRIVGRNRPHLACALWLVVLLKCLTPPVVSSPSGIFCWLQRAERASDQGAEVGDAQSAMPVAALSSAAGAEEDAVVVQVSRTAPSAAAGQSPRPIPLTTASEPPTASVPQRAWSWSLLLASAGALWLAGILIYAAVAARRWVACWRKLRVSRQIDDPSLALLIDNLCRRLKLQRRVRLLVTDSPLGPAVVGLWRPTVILPAAIMRDKSPTELEPLLAHELIHVRRGDLWIGMLQTLALGLWWFHPLVRLASRLVTREAERCCDEEVIAHLGCDPAQYARSLIDVLALKQQLTPIPAFPGVRPVDVTSQRLERIMKLGQGCHRRTPWWCWLAMLTLAAAVLPGAALVVGAKEKQKATPPDLSGARLHTDFLSPDAQPAVFAEPLTERTYEVADLVAALAKQLQEPENEARRFLVQVVQSAAPGPWELSERIGVEFGDAPADPTYIRDVKLIGDPTKRSLGWSEGKLLVRQTADGHRRIAEQLDVLRQHGHAELAIEVRILSGQKAVLNAAGVDWQMIGGGPEVGPAPVEKPARHSYLAPVGTVQSRIIVEEEPALGELRGTAESVVERHVPAMLALVEEKQAAELIAAVQADSRSNILCAPKVTLFNGQSARVEDVTKRPFVVGVTPVTGPGGSALQPKIRVVTEGTAIRLLPVAKEDGSIELDFGLTLSSIRDVETAEFPTEPGKDPITIQVPEVAATRLNATVEMIAEQTLVLSLPKTGQGKKEQQPMCVLVKVKKVSERKPSGEGEKSIQVTPQVVQKASSARQPREQFAFETSGWQLKFTPRSGGLLAMECADDKNPLADVRIREVILEAVAEKQGNAKSDRIVAQADAVWLTTRPAAADAPARLQIALDGNVRLVHNESRIEAKQALLQFDNPQVGKSEPGNKPATVHVQVNEARSIDLQPGAKAAYAERAIAPAASHDASLPEASNPAPLINKVYPVADLVIPIPTGPIKISPTGALVKRESPAQGKPDFDTLIELITKTIEPETWNSWERVGGQGRISVATSSLSLVIRQEDRVHAQIAALLNQLRRLQDIQVVLALEHLEVPAAELEKAAANEPDSPLSSIVKDPQGRAWCLKPGAISILKKLRTAKVQTGPKITVFSGQSVDLQMAEEGQQPPALLSQLLIQPVVTADFRSLRLQIFGDAGPQTGPQPEAVEDKLGLPPSLAGDKTSATSQLPVELRELALGQVLVVDESQFAWQEREMGVPVLDKVPYTARLFKNASARQPEMRHFYLITPRMLVTDEEEVQVLAPTKKK